MRKFILIMSALVMCFAVSVFAQKEAYTRQNALLEKMRWLPGVWQRESNRNVTEETWRKLSDRTFEGESVRISKASGDTVFTESLLMAEMQGELFYVPKVAENP